MKKVTLMTYVYLYRCHHLLSHGHSRAYFEPSIPLPHTAQANRSVLLSSFCELYFVHKIIFCFVLLILITLFNPQVLCYSWVK